MPELTPFLRRRFVELTLEYDKRLEPEAAETAAFADLGITAPEQRFILRGELAPRDKNIKWLSAGQLADVTGRPVGQLASWVAAQHPQCRHNNRLWISAAAIDAFSARAAIAAAPECLQPPQVVQGQSEYVCKSVLASMLHIHYATLVRREAELLAGLEPGPDLIKGRHAYLRADVEAWLKTEQGRRVYGAPLPGELSNVGINARLRPAAAAAGMSGNAFAHRFFIKPEPCRVTPTGMQFYAEAEVDARLQDAVAQAAADAAWPPANMILLHDVASQLGISKEKLYQAMHYYPSDFPPTTILSYLGHKYALMHRTEFEAWMASPAALKYLNHPLPHELSYRDVLDMLLTLNRHPSFTSDSFMRLRSQGRMPLPCRTTVSRFNFWNRAEVEAAITKLRQAAA